MGGEFSGCVYEKSDDVDEISKRNMFSEQFPVNYSMTVASKTNIMMMTLETAAIHDAMICYRLASRRATKNTSSSSAAAPTHNTLVKVVTLDTTTLPATLETPSKVK